MGLIQSILIIVLALIVISTFITEPKLSYEYYKVALKSAKMMAVKAKSMFEGWQDDEVSKENVQEVQGTQLQD